MFAADLCVILGKEGLLLRGLQLCESLVDGVCVVILVKPHQPVRVEYFEYIHRKNASPDLAEGEAMGEMIQPMPASKSSRFDLLLPCPTAAMYAKASVVLPSYPAFVFCSSRKRLVYFIRGFGSQLSSSSSVSL